MARNAEIEYNADSIVAEYGKRWFTFGEAKEIMCCGVNTVAFLLNEAGVTVKRVGAKKLVSAYDIAYAMSFGRVSPIDNETRVGLLRAVPS